MLSRSQSPSSCDSPVKDQAADQRSETSETVTVWRSEGRCPSMHRVEGPNENLSCASLQGKSEPRCVEGDGPVSSPPQQLPLTISYSLCPDCILSDMHLTADQSSDLVPSCSKLKVKASAVKRHTQSGQPAVIIG